MTNSLRPVIVINAFGSTLTSGLKELENVDRMVRVRYPGYDVRWGLGGKPTRQFLSESGQTTIFERKVPVKSPVEVYDDLRKEGKRDVAVVYLYPLPGSIEIIPLITANDTRGLNAEFGFPLLAPPENIARTADALVSWFGDEDTVTIVCNLGNSEIPTLNLPLLQMDNYLRKHYPRVFLATLGGPPGTEAAFTDARKAGLQKVKFIPLIFAAGRRVIDAIMGDSPTSFRSQLGLEASCTPSLGNNPEVVSIWMESIDWSLAKFLK